MLQIVAPYGPGAASSRVRVYQWLDRLREPSCAEVSSYLGSANTRPRTLLTHPVPTVQAELRLRRVRATAHDRLFLHRQASPFSRGRLEGALLSRAGLGVYDFDDALQWDTRGRLQDLLFSNPVQCTRSVEAADRVIAGSDVLADWATGHCADVRVIPSCVEPADYPTKTDYSSDDVFRLVWLGSPATERYLSVLAEPLTLLARAGKVRLTVISAGDQPLGPLEPWVDRVAWGAGTFARALVAADAGLAPLTDEPYARGKCAYKVLQYAAVGLPSVVSPVGANAVAATKLGFRVAGTTDEWVDHLADLIAASSETRRQEGARAVAAVDEHYSYDAWHGSWLEAVGIGQSA